MYQFEVQALTGGCIAGTMSLVSTTVDDLKQCSTCSKQVKQLRKKMCQACYRRFMWNGSTTKRTRKPPMSWEVVENESERDPENGCLIWKGSVDKDGFPRYYDSARYDAGENNVMVYVRRWILEQLGHEMGRRYIAEDICGNRKCVEKTHLVKATYTSSKKMMAAINARKTECVNGHPFTTENTYIADGGRRQCKQCRWAAVMRHQGKDPDQLERGLPNADKEYCPRGHPYEGEHLYVDSLGNRHCISCRRINHLKRKYNLSEEEYIRIRTRQDHRCAICLTDFDKLPIRQVVVDHCHTTGRVRGILCHHCNVAIGYFRDDPNAIRRAAAYLSDQL